MKQAETYQYSATHIDAARNSTDDFNLFHDKKRWLEIRNNPFQGPIALGFQLLGLVAEKVRQHRLAQNENIIIDEHHLDFSYYQVNFAQVVKPEDWVLVEIKKSQLKKESQVILSNRFSLRTQSSLALIGYKRESQMPLILDDIDFSQLDNVYNLKDRSFIEDNRYFVKRKFLNASNGKNFLIGSLVEQSEYIDELVDKVYFPEVFSLALTSCALLERANKLQHDFRNNPMVYVSQQHCINRKLNECIKSNDMLTMLVKNKKDDTETETFHCYGLLTNREILFRSILSLVPLKSILK